MKKSTGAVKYILKNKKAKFLYHIDDYFEAGIVLKGTEVKSVRQGKISLTDSYCKVHDSELFIYNLNIAVYDDGSYFNHDPVRKRKLLMHRREITKLRTKLVTKGFTLIPTAVYFKRGWTKIELGLAKGRQKVDKREYLKKKEAKREIRKYMGDKR